MSGLLAWLTGPRGAEASIPPYRDWKSLNDWDLGEVSGGLNSYCHSGRVSYHRGPRRVRSLKLRRIQTSSITVEEHRKSTLCSWSSPSSYTLFSRKRRRCGHSRVFRLQRSIPVYWRMHRHSVPRHEFHCLLPEAALYRSHSLR